jgi:hypothetical protein
LASPARSASSSGEGEPMEEEEPEGMRLFVMTEIEAAVALLFILEKTWAMNIVRSTHRVETFYLRGFGSKFTYHKDLYFYDC